MGRSGRDREKKDGDGWQELIERTEDMLEIVN